MASAKKTENNVLTELRQQVQVNEESSQPLELNNKIGQIDSRLDRLTGQLTSMNAEVHKRLEALQESDDDISGKVSETFKYLGDLDNQYKALGEQSSSIKQEIKALALDLKTVTQEASEGIASLKGGHAELMERVNELSKKSKATATKLEKSIRENAEAMKALEDQLMGEINALAEVNEQRNNAMIQRADKLDKRVGKAERDLESHNARMLKMAAVDEALAKRASSLESTTEDLTQASKELKNAARSLDYRTKKLAGEVAQLQQHSILHFGLITDLQTRATGLSQNLASLAKLEKTHFLGTLGLFVIVLGIIGGVIVSQASNWKNEALANAGIQSGVSNVDSKVRVIQAKVSELQKKFANIKDETSSLSGRLSAVSPFSSFGETSTVHGPHWVAQQAPNTFVIHLATEDSKEALYKLVDRYSHYLKNEVAFVPVTVDGATRYALISTGYASGDDALAALDNMPHSINWQTPRVFPMSEIQASIR